MTRRRRRLLIPIIHLITRIYTHIVFAPIKFAFHSHSVSFRVVSCPCHRRSSSISFLLRPLLQIKSFISSSYFLPINGYLSSARCISCTIRAVGFVPFVRIPPTLPLDFFSYYSSDTWTRFSFLFSSYAKWPRSLSLVIMRVFTLGLVFCFTLILNCVIN
jgi:hypothetical protein